MLLLVLVAAWLPTTDGRIAVGNLDAQIAGLTRAGDHGRELLELYLTRAQYLGSPGDYDQAEAIVEQMVRTPQHDMPLRPYFFRVQVRAALHQFRAAFADADRLYTYFGPTDAMEALRASLWQATGDEEKALPILEKRAKQHADLQSLGQLAVLKGLLGEVDEAERLFREGEASYHDASPFAVAWLEFQWGLMCERAGRLSTARELYQSAYERLPQYAPAIGHLAGVLAHLGEKERAIRLLEPLADRLDDPEYAAQLLTLRPDEKLRARAAKRYNQLLKKHPEAYADHGARFFLGQPRAIELAKLNLANRHTDEAYQLLIDALLAAKKDACPAAEEALRQRPRAGMFLRVAVANAWTRCGKMSQAEKLLSAPAPSPPATTPPR
jgi:tetratricopeptide (TPR) repeat protein